MFHQVLRKATLAATLILGMAGVAQAVTVPVGDKCGNKFISLTQDGVTLSPTICSDQNSTGSKSPIAKAGWSDGAEFSPKDGLSTDELGLSVNTSTGAWSITNLLGYPMLGISVKQGDGFAFYVLDLEKALSGFYYTGSKASPTGHDVSHINAWYKGDPTPQVPLPAGLPLLALGLGALALVRRRKA